MKLAKLALLAGAVSVLSLGLAFGGVAAAKGVEDYNVTDLGKTLTPFGAIKAGNADGSIPAWTGGVTSPPAGYHVGDHHPAPFAADQAIVTITAANMAQYGDMLTAGQKAMLQQYPTFHIALYPSHRTASAPQAVYDDAMANALHAKLTDDGNGVVDSTGAVPFPVPKNGLEAIWNHLLRWRGYAVHRWVGQANPLADGSYTMVDIDEQTLFNFMRPEAKGDNISLYFIQQVMGPPRLAGEILLVHDTINQIAEPRSAWTYNAGQRRVRRAPNVAYDNPGTAADGLRTSDQLDMYNGSPDRYTWELQGRREMIVPYNDYALHAKGIAYDTLIKPKHINPDYLRYEKHRVWVVDAKLKPGTSHIYPHRVFYIDEDSWQVLAVDNYDSRGQLWRYQESYGINYYDVPTYWSTLDATYDLPSGRYTAIGFDNNSKMYDFSEKMTPGDFTPDQLRREGIR